VLGFFQGWAPTLIVDTIASFSFLAHFNAITEGVIDLRDLVFFLSLIAVWLYANAVVVDFKKAG
jgi:ABC-2 type transport system permease protein